MKQGRSRHASRRGFYQHVVRLLICVFVLGVSAGPAMAEPLAGHYFYGPVTIGGVPVPEGTLVVATVDGLEFSTLTAADGTYGYSPNSFSVPGDSTGEDGAKPGELIVLTVDGQYADECAFIVGGPVDPYFPLDVSVPQDWGDAHDPTYPTLAASNGAVHTIVPGLFLGALIDAEPDGQPDPMAMGDDLANQSDEDGVVFTSPLFVGTMAAVDVTASAPGLLNAWLDVNADGDWADVGEQIFVDTPLVAGVNHLTFAVPTLGVVGSTFARFRFGSQPGLSYDGPASDGEVEDYYVELELAELSVDVSKALISDPDIPVLVGDPVQFRITVTNTGQIEFISNPITDTFSGPLVFVDATQDAQPVAVAPNAQNQLVWDMAVINGGPVLPGQVVEIDMSFVADAPGLAENMVQVVEYDDLGRSATDQDMISFEIFPASVMITATAGAGGSIDPTGEVSVTYADDQAFSITPDDCFVVADVLVDGVSVGATDVYTFSGVIENHTIEAQFAAVPDLTITATAGAGGSIDPMGDVTVACGADQLFVFTPDDCFVVADVLVDGVSVGAGAGYLFENVTADHTIEAQFAAAPDLTIAATAGTGGSIDPMGDVPVACGADKAFSITPDAHYEIADVLVDGISIGAVSDYTFTGVVEDHTIEAQFSATFDPFAPSLPEGWNIFSTPIQLDPAQDTLTDIFVPTEAIKLEILYAWDAQNEMFVQASGTDELNPLDAIFIKVAEGETATATLVPSTDLTFPPKKALVAGLNLVGPAPAYDNGQFPAMPLDQAWVSIAQAPDGMTGMTMAVSQALNQPGWVYALGGTVQDLLPYNGYWVVMENPDELFGFSSTPIEP